MPHWPKEFKTTAAQTSVPPPSSNQTQSLLVAGSPVVGVRARSLGICLRHILPFLGLAVVLRSRAVIDLRRRVHPNHSRAAACRLLHRRRRLTRSLGRSSSHRSRSSSRGRLHRHRSRRSRRSSSRRQPRLYPFMSPASTLLTGSRRVRSVLALPRRSRRSLCQCHIYGQQPCRNRQ